ncbi:dual specificity protein phosphatase 12-like isoform X2 [Dreissena polymorpha]|uniref:dual specificity protein phosphatase 12-like isoform X2 n=1 Tax=Dreissena polymorpha TaxID=45954 RepID=UPI0022645669|nr:dual specificity protein phosphatase 12-like isoform X2 [Dreissena polymorpha]
MTSENLTKIVDSLYLGDFTAGTDTELLKEHGITHILTVDMTQHYLPCNPGTEDHMFVNCMDLPSADLLSRFDECFKFVDNALKSPGNRLLIHCFAGVSRSATVMIAYLMYRDGMCLDEAYGTVKEMRPIIKPNPGFMEQLELFEQMESKIDESNPMYKTYKLQVMAERIQAGEELSESDLCSTDIQTNNESFYRCMKCRQALFKTTSVMRHKMGEGEAAFDWRSKLPANQKEGFVSQTIDSTDCDKSLFIEPVRWMADSIRDMEGKLNCPKCKLKLGSFIWYGEKCPCGTWVAPAFHIQGSKVDLIKPRPLANVHQLTFSNGGQSDSRVVKTGQSDSSVLKMAQTDSSVVKSESNQLSS